MALRLPFLFVILWNCPLTAQYSIFYSFVTSEARGTGKTGICSFLSESSVLNPAGIAKIKQASIALESHNYYLVKGLYSGFLSYQKPFKNSGIFGCIGSDGSAEFNDFFTAFAYSRALSQKSHIGMTVNYIHSKRSFSEETNHLAFSLGFQSNLLTNVQVGLVFQNPIQLDQEFQHFNKSIYKIGLCYQLSNFTEINIECHLNNFKTESVHIGFRYAIYKQLEALSGFQTNPVGYGFGLIATINKKCKITSSFENHLLLGWSPSFAIKWILESKS